MILHDTNITRQKVKSIGQDVMPYLRDCPHQRGLCPHWLTCYNNELIKICSTSFKMFITQVCCVFRPAVGCCANLKASAAPESWSKYFLLAVLRLFSSFCLLYLLSFLSEKKKKDVFLLTPSSAQIKHHLSHLGSQP